MALVLVMSLGVPVLAGGSEEVDSSADYQNYVDFLPKITDMLYLCEASLVMAGRAYFMRNKNIAGYGVQPRYLLPGSITLDEKKLPTIEFIRKVVMLDKRFTP